ncbi:peptide deformylase 1A, chloroplastic [Solanum stenotomum]|uniref:peptide deformylase 1A, chloroplastic n=1 Tax=Solanum stenotomum TaxID=172797 RepID=UPI0020D118FF|nr:peptide deformylase 1A, chloroplastic [Solanum stenotomum]XP_049412372.1 peptide deformylase 1A, chloroplastic [Solanum stenotomum]XP_049412373.1 peptide deformylase 1A, chloroplastic [Solanum stenotomum]XP_049412374.1 peptide deformylase 1A, chloroplastic [Solanum stenotomum]
MERFPRLAQRILSVPFTPKYLKSCKKTNPLTSHLMQLRGSQRPVFIQWNLQGRPSVCTDSVSKRNYSSTTAQAGWFLGLGEKKKQVMPDIVKAGDPVLHEPSQDVPLEEIGSERIQKIIDEMVKVMRNAPGVGLAAPQIGIPLKIIVLEDTNEYISYAPKDETKAQDRRPFDLLVIINPKLKKKGNKTALFFEGCLSVDGFRAVVERHLQVEVTGLDRNGKAIKVDASGWQARILQHKYDHLDGTIYVDKMFPRTFRTVENLDLPLAAGCPKLGVC